MRLSPTETLGACVGQTSLDCSTAEGRCWGVCLPTPMLHWLRVTPRALAPSGCLFVDREDSSSQRDPGSHADALQ